MNHKEVHIIASPKPRGNQTSIEFTSDSSPQTPFLIPEQPGVYRVNSRTNGRTFYVGETRNLKQRLKFLFRCNSPKNPHPCHTFYTRAFGVAPDCKTFCEEFVVAFINTSGMTGRIEIEEQLQGEHRCNNASFYNSWQEINSTNS